MQLPCAMYELILHTVDKIPRTDLFPHSSEMVRTGSRLYPREMNGLLGMFQRIAVEY